MQVETPQVIWTIGHSNHPLPHLLEMLDSAAIELLVDVRRFPGSRRHPQFQQDHLCQALQQAGIDYRHEVALGGRRSRRAADSPNGGWRVAAFQAYADYMLTDEFVVALESLQQAALDQRTAIMCSEAVPWRCHRRLIADALLIRGWSVQDIFAVGRFKPHALTEFAQVEGLQLTYPANS